MVKKSNNSFSKIIQEFDSMDASNSFELKKILNSYPYFQSASAYYLKTLKSQEKDSYNKLLPKTAILTFNRSILRNWLYNDEIKGGQSNNKTEKYSFLDWFDIISDDKPKVDEKFDILYRDAAGQIVSSRADGASVNLLGFKAPWINILVNYPNATSSFYSFNIVEKIFAYSQHKYGDMPIRKVGSYFGKCK